MIGHDRSSAIWIILPTKQKRLLSRPSNKLLLRFLCLRKRKQKLYFSLVAQFCINAPDNWNVLNFRHSRSVNVATFLDCKHTRGSQIALLLFFTFYFRASEWLWGPNWLQTWLRLKLSLWKWQGADLPGWQWAIGHHWWQMCSGTKVAGCWGRQNAFSHSCFFFFSFLHLLLPLLSTQTGSWMN